jgi:hypothetical protein
MGRRRLFRLDGCHLGRRFRGSASYLARRRGGRRPGSYPTCASLSLPRLGASRSASEPLSAGVPKPLAKGRRERVGGGVCVGRERPRRREGNSGREGQKLKREGGETTGSPRRIGIAEAQRSRARGRRPIGNGLPKESESARKNAKGGARVRRGEHLRSAPSNSGRIVGLGRRPRNHGPRTRLGLRDPPGDPRPRRGLRPRALEEARGQGPMPQGQGHPELRHRPGRSGRFPGCTPGRPPRQDHRDPVHGRPTSYCSTLDSFLDWPWPWSRTRPSASRDSRLTVILAPPGPNRAQGSSKRVGASPCSRHTIATASRARIKLPDGPHFPRDLAILRACVYLRRQYHYYE